MALRVRTPRRKKAAALAWLTPTNYKPSS
jgi:hypothetical protein